MHLPTSIHNPFTMQTDAPYSLKFLVYLQNAYSNSMNSDSRALKFPYVDISAWALINEERFLEVFPEVWKQVKYRITSQNKDHGGVFTTHYEELSTTISEGQRLTISLVNDQFDSSLLRTLPWYAVIPSKIQDIFFRKRHEDTLALLLSCCK